MLIASTSGAGYRTPAFTEREPGASRSGSRPFQRAFTAREVKIVLATGNKDKVRELQVLFGDVPIDVAPDGFDPEETGTTLFQNARIKAEALRADVPDDVIVMADDSGLFVHALGGRPGVYSSRYAGPNATYADNCNLLIKELGNEDDRGAAFGCCLVALARVARCSSPTACCPARSPVRPAVTTGSGTTRCFDRWATSAPSPR